MLFSVLCGASALCALWPATLFCINLRRFQPPPPLAPTAKPVAISVLIPARNEEANIGPALQHVLASRDVVLEVLVLDDSSTDGTAERVRAIAVRDARVSLLEGVPLPHGWNGKQFACWTLAQRATEPLLVFLDADVRIEPDLLARMAAFLQQSDSALVSGFPRLVTVTSLEKLLLPLIHFVLLAFLPMGSMRRTQRTSVAAGCGQFFLADRAAYFASGGHNALRESMHDGLMLPRAFRRAGFRTDLADITALASVRMYDSPAKVWQGLAKNATEGIATPGRIAPLSLILILGQVVPALVAAALLLGAGWLAVFGRSRGASVDVREPRVALLMLGAFSIVLIAGFVPRLLAVRRFRQPLGSALLHPVGVTTLLVLQWYALARKLFGRPVGWRQRTYSSGSGTEVGGET